jgi:DNA ligase-1
MPDLADGESTFIQGSGAKPYELKNTGGVYSCSCPAWRNQSAPIEKRTCKHLRKLRGDAAETARLGAPLTAPVRKSSTNPDGTQKPGAPVLLAEVWDGHLDPTDWWMSEKLDGVRAYWDGKQLLSRLGNIYHAPDWFLKGLPATPLDGELFLARKSFQKTIAVVRRQDKSDHWKNIKFLIFDSPALDAPFEHRIESLKSLPALPHAALHAHTRCTGIPHLKEQLAQIESLGGEGLMIRQPQSKYVVGRSSTLLKIKSFLDDEATVVAHQAGSGKHKGRLGALVVRLPNGIEFSIGTGFSDQQRQSPPPVGATVVFRYQELSDGGVPRFPSFSSVREEA